MKINNNNKYTKQNQIIHADCFNIFKTMNDDSVDLTITDIPYNQINTKSNGRDRYAGQLRKLDKGIADSSEVNITLLIRELVRVTTNSIYIFCEYEQVSDIVRLFRMNELSVRVLVWEKTNPSPLNCSKNWVSGVEMCVYGRFPKATFNGHYRNTVLKYPTKRSKLHPTEKPQSLLIDLIKTSSNEGDLVLDCCAGSGSTGLASVSLNRKFICIEKDKEYFKIIKDRLGNQIPCVLMGIVSFFLVM
jgi:site-specific DNA-methyltransferase (adenine-specific)